MWEWAGTLVKPPCLRGNAGCAPSLHYTLALVLQMRKNHSITSVTVTEKCLVKHCWARFILATSSPLYRLPLLVCKPQSPPARTSGDLGQPSIHANICQIAKLRGSHTNFKSELSVRALMWSAKDGTPKPSRNCLLPMYHGAPVAMWRHLDWSTCSLLAWAQAVNLQLGQT
jgi:hypothetical protein